MPTRWGSVLLDTEDFLRLRWFKWHITLVGGFSFACRTRAGRTIYLHRAVYPHSRGLITHRSADTLDNRKENLFISATQLRTPR